MLGSLGMDYRSSAIGLAVVLYGCVGNVGGTTEIPDPEMRPPDAATYDAGSIGPGEPSDDAGGPFDGSTDDAAIDEDASADASAHADATTDTAPPSPEPPGMLPLPDGSDVVDDVARDHPEWLRDSCLETGGSNDFVFEVVRRLRLTDDRWGLNWKRGAVGDMSQDVIDYHFGAGPREGSTEVYIIDIIVGHCGPAPGAGWLDQTEATAAAGTIGRWTLEPLP